MNMNLDIPTYYQGGFQLSHVQNMVLWDIIRGAVKEKWQLTEQIQRVVISQRRLRKWKVEREQKIPKKSKQKLHKIHKLLNLLKNSFIKT